MRHALLALPLLACSASSTSTTTPVAAKPLVTLTYLGVAGWSLDDGGHALLVDPYFSRREVSDDDVLLPQDDVVAKYAPGHADVILVEHSHYDHLLDVPLLATQTRATVIGTDSTARVLAAFHVQSDHVIVAHGGETFERAPFTIRVFPGLHSLTGQKNEPIADGVAWPLHAKDFHEGGTLHYLVTAEGRSVLFVSSANFVESALTGLRPDVAVIAVGLREKVPDYTCRLMKALGAPPLVLPDHFDAFRKPLDAGGKTLDDDTKADLATFESEVHACAPKTRVVVPKHFEGMAIAE